MKLSQYIDGLQAKGSYCFRGEEVGAALESSTVATRAALRRLKQHGAIATPFRGFYAIVLSHSQKTGQLVKLETNNKTSSHHETNPPKIQC